MLGPVVQASGLLRGKAVEAAITCFQTLEVLSINHTSAAAADQLLEPLLDTEASDHLVTRSTQNCYGEGKISSVKTCTLQCRP